MIGEPTELVCSKIASRLNALTRQLIERSPLLLLATSDAEGHVDVSPRGDPTGFVRILDDDTLLIPERRATASPTRSATFSRTRAWACSS